MRIMITPFLFLFALLNWTLAIAEDVPVYTADQTYIQVSKNQVRFSIKLVANPTTGYGWNYHYDDRVLRLHSHKYIRSTSGKMGAPGYEIWTFDVKTSAFSKAQQTFVGYQYKRPWETQGKVNVNFIVNVAPE